MNPKKPSRPRHRYVVELARVVTQIVQVEVEAEDDLAAMDVAEGMEPDFNSGTTDSRVDAISARPVE
jgi:hypothetical protein